ncbi:ATP-binding protein [Anditalea andensis]|uniref:Histidine kinase domain-containing protein n=1 Tax=Anditalea andensis TaxID=1048983 RepID=A0A074L4V5_9BACT|nr:ATP-binding protein [Anditalea andensis]KEO75515.1 hypothetical protein EL17_01310 [Anditalea andensis]
MAASIFTDLSIAKDENRSIFERSIHSILSGHQPNLIGVLVSGFPGTGKSFFVENYLYPYAQSYPMLTIKHHPQLKNIPFSSFKSGLTDFLSNLYNTLSGKEYERFSYSLKTHFGETYPLILDYIPELSLLAGNHSFNQEGVVQKIENQLYSLIKRLFEFVASYFQKPVLFFTDDLQWMGTSEINLLKFLLVELGTDTLIWVGACRTEHEKVTPVSQLIDSLGFKNRQIEHIKIKNLNVHQSRTFLEHQWGNPCASDLLNLCFQITKGHLFHLQLLSDSIMQSGYIELKGGLWTGDIPEIATAFEGLNLQNILSNYLGKISSRSLEIMELMACIGSCDRALLADCLGEKESHVIGLINECITNGILEQKAEKIQLSDRHVGELLYQGLSAEKAASYHYQIAMLYYKRQQNQNDNPHTILAASHLNQALSQVRILGEMRLGARLNFQAGLYSKQKNALEQSKSFFKMSCALLRECRGEEVSSLLWESYLERATVEYYLGEYDLAEIHLDYLLDSFINLQIRVPAFRLKIIINNHLGRYKKALQILKESLDELGVTLPDRKCVDKEVLYLKSIVDNNDINPFLDPDANNLQNHNQEVSDLLYVGGMALHHTSEVLMTWAALQIILRSDFTKNSGVKAIGYVSYARMRIIAGDIPLGMNYGQKAIEINMQLCDMQLRCRVYGVYAFYILPWHGHFSQSLHLLSEGIEAGRRTGDLIGVYILKTHQLNLHFISGRPLSDIMAYEFDQSLPGVELTYYITHYQKALVNFLLCNTPIFALPQQQSLWQGAKLTVQEEMFYRNYVWARYYFLFGHYDLAEKAAFEANENRKLQEASPLVPANTIIRFLSITQNWSCYGVEQKQLFILRLKATLEKMERWYRYSPDNYEHNYWLLQAEWLRINGQHKEARYCFQKALDNSGDNLYQLAITHELYAKYLFSIKNHVKALKEIQLAIKAFTAWGAIAKVNQLTQQYRAAIQPVSVALAEMDMETVQRELSSDLNIDSLVNKLMVLLMRISGSTGVVIRMDNDMGELSPCGQLSLLYQQGELMASHHITIPESLLMMAHRTQNPLILHDVFEENTIRDLASLRDRNIQSFIIMPLTITGNLSLVIYLENTFSKHWYDEHRLKEIRIVANQGAVIIENAKTHEKSIRLNEELRKEMDEKQVLAEVIENQKDKHLKDLVDIQDKERNRIASELHDSLGSLLSTVKMRFNNLQEDASFSYPLKAQDYEDALYMLDDAIEEVRKIAHSMSTASLKRFGLPASLQTFIEKINAANQLEVELQILGMHQRISDQLEVAIYRICQELVQNVIKHAGATHLNIQMINHQNLVNIIVDDNGIGMDLSKIKQGFGFLTIQSKVSLLKGTLHIESREGHGTMILIDIPL